MFFAAGDRGKFLSLLQAGMEKYGHRIHAYCLMSNHVHLLVQVAEIPLSQIVHNLSFRYTRFFNQRKNQGGHLFQGRYKALLLDTDSYLLELVRYIHNNPVRAGVVTAPEEFPWSSHCAYLGKTSTPWLTADWVLAHFSGNRKTAVRLYRQFVLEGRTEPRRDELSHGTIDGRILGKECFAESVVEKLSRQVPRKATLEQIVQAVCRQYGITEDDLAGHSRRKRVAEPRAVAALLVRDHEDLRLTSLSQKLRHDLSGLSQAASRLDKRLKLDQQLANQVSTIRGIF